MVSPNHRHSECLDSLCDVVDNYGLTGSSPAVGFPTFARVHCRVYLALLVGVTMRSHCATVLQTAVDCERAFLAALDGNCKTPIAGQVSLGNKLVEEETMQTREDT